MIQIAASPLAGATPAMIVRPRRCRNTHDVGLLAQPFAITRFAAVG